LAFRGSESRGGSDFGIESFKLPVHAKSRRGKGKIPEKLRDNSRWAPIEFWGFGTQEVELHGQHNSRNREERNTKRWVPSISQRIRAAKVKGGVKLR
jgi:hypothetical protein